MNRLERHGDTLRTKRYCEGYESDFVITRSRPPETALSQ